MKTCVILNHQLTAEQKNELGGEIVEMPAELKKLWGTIPPDVPRFEVGKYLQPLWDWLEKEYPDRVVGQGEATAFALLLMRCCVFNTPLLVATSRRETVEEVMPDGSVVKKAIFKHVQFREV